MKKLNKKGFTLIELLAVIVIMGILMLVAIPAVQRTIENSRRDTFVNTAKTYLNAVKTLVASDELTCGTATIGAAAGSTSGTTYFYQFNSANTTGTDLVDQGGKSSWSNKNVNGYVKILKKVNGTKTSYEYSISMVDENKHGFTTVVDEKNLSRNIVTSSNTSNSATSPGGTSCTITTS